MEISKELSIKLRRVLSLQSKSSMGMCYITPLAGEMCIVIDIDQGSYRDVIIERLGIYEDGITLGLNTNALSDLIGKIGKGGSKIKINTEKELMESDEKTIGIKRIDGISSRYEALFTGRKDYLELNNSDLTDLSEHLETSAMKMRDPSASSLLTKYYIKINSEAVTFASTNRFLITEISNYRNGKIKQEGEVMFNGYLMNYTLSNKIKGSSKIGIAENREKIGNLSYSYIENGSTICFTENKPPFLIYDSLLKKDVKNIATIEFKIKTLYEAIEKMENSLLAELYPRKFGVKTKEEKSECFYIGLKLVEKKLGTIIVNAVFGKKKKEMGFNTKSDVSEEEIETWNKSKYCFFNAKYFKAMLVGNGAGVLEIKNGYANPITFKESNSKYDIHRILMPLEY